MSSDPRASRPSYLPGGDILSRAVPSTRQPQRVWFRVHRAGVSAIDFTLRSHHRFSHAQCPHPVLYLGASVAVCLWEYFGDDVFGGRRVIAASRWARCRLSRITVPALSVCAVSLESTRSAMGVDKASLLSADLAVPQAWGLAMQRHPAGFDAIKYTSRFVDQPCLALFDRGGMTGRLKESVMGDLDDLDAAVDWLDERKVALV